MNFFKKSSPKLKENQMSIEAMKLALEALENNPYALAYSKAITSLRQAIEQAEKPKCNPHPKAPHGFDRNASHGADRYVCECESWDAYDAGIEEGMKRERALWEKAENARELGLDYEPVQAEKQEPVAVWELFADGWDSIADPEWMESLPVGTKLYTTPQPQQAEKQEPWVWQQSPIKTQWGDDMVVADLAIDKDHTVSVYCERDQTARVEAMFRGKNT